LDRRAFISSVTGGLVAAPLAAAAQPVGKVWRIGLFHVGLDHVPPSLDGLRDGLKVPVYRREVRQVGTTLRFQPVERDVRSQGDIERVFASLSRSAVDGVFIASLNLRVKFHALILRLASEHHLPVAGHRKEWVEQGALFSYAENIREVGRAAAAHYVDKILRGAKPADLPIEAYEHPELVINLKTAKALGLTIPPSLLQRADQVIER
jgi:putative ABC transport system substrate-binding protein